ncbi:ankyrin repeat domain-containing protein [Sulfurospirillum sp. UCH001]|uniref:ankyrin repeat domain-containing protein n=1 Tax=Sulfurospirillum sp. UCH001 TaxID=1581011 RepID=UPI00082DCCF5|nr:ankyrin repeat domain-containing protein [Sulfurospirillum sp. UCH001]
MIRSPLKKLRNALINYSDAKIIEAVKNDRVIMVRLLLMVGVNPNAKDSSNITLLMLACAKSHLKIIKLLLYYKASIYEKDHDGWTASKWAYFKNDRDVIILLKQYAKLQPFYSVGEPKINVFEDFLLVVNDQKSL